MVEIVFIGDDFTGASDTLATLAERGANVQLFLDAPEAGETDGLDAVGIATDLRTRSPEEIDARLRALVPSVRRLAPRFVHYKICSTFDSAPHVGSIGAAVLTLEEGLAPCRTILLGGQPSLGRYCLFANLFARAPDGRTYRIDRHPIMRAHPVTPMGEADLRVHLAMQGLHGLVSVNREELRSGPNALQPRGNRILVDAVEQPDVDRFGELLRGITQDAPVLVVGASGVAEALVLGGPSLMQPAANADWRTGPVLAIAGSRSSATAAQVFAAASYERLPVEPGDLTQPAQLVDRSVRHLAAGRNVLVHLQPSKDYGCSPAALSRFLADLTHAVFHRHRPARLLVAGGDTSSAVVERLRFRSLSFVQRMGSGVAVCRGHAPDGSVDGTTLLLKGGQVGDVNLFDRYVAEAANSYNFSR
ncbi:MAG: four-carbon acid sugar kinase family protein [Rhizobiaceae bacterium]|nr:four-carbon acid sugar kinase family protein [Rhizobiaceae bacterium]MCV0405938.1 four-carbon acid sugar kinase family protein [Rhizobiaceae bacterium]